MDDDRVLVFGWTIPLNLNRFLCMTSLNHHINSLIIWFQVISVWIYFGTTLVLYWVALKFECKSKICALKQNQLRTTCTIPFPIFEKKRRGKDCYVYHFWHGNDVLPVLFPALTTFCMVPCCNLSFDRSHFLSPQPALDDWLVITEGRCCIWCVMCYSNLYVSVDRFQDNQWVVIRTS